MAAQNYDNSDSGQYFQCHAVRVAVHNCICYCSDYCIFSGCREQFLAFRLVQNRRFVHRNNLVSRKCTILNNKAGMSSLLSTPLAHGNCARVGVEIY